MPNPPPISVPAGFAPAFALGFSDSESRLSIVSSNAPLPVAIADQPAASPDPLSGETSASLLAGPFQPVPGIPIILTLSGEWTGTVRLLRSMDGGDTLTPLLVGGMVWGTFHEQGCEQVWIETEEGATFHLDIALTSGTLAYRVSQ